VESFELVVVGNSTGSRIREKCKGIIPSFFLGRIDSCRPLDTSVFWKRSEAGFTSIITQRCSNMHGRFLVVEEYGGAWRRFILVPEGRNGKG
jgi:hypothetical protein